MKEKILENKKTIAIGLIAVLIISTIAFFLLKDKEVQEVENSANYSDEIMTLVDNTENLDSFETTSTFTATNENSENEHNYQSLTVGKIDIKNKLAHIKVDETLNGVDSVREHYSKEEGNISKRYNYINSDWHYEETGTDSVFYNLNFIREQLSYAKYTTTEEDNKITVKASYTTETMIDNDIKEHLNPEATYSYEFIFDNGYLIEYQIKIESSDYNETTEGVFTNFNEEMNIVIPDKALNAE